jgi:hypothetical protein
VEMFFPKKVYESSYWEQKPTKFTVDKVLFEGLFEKVGWINT